MPLTPANSTEIVAEEQSPSSHTELFSHLPAPALPQDSIGKISGTLHRAIQPANASPYSLPPPPTRSRRIIHMTPKPPTPEKAKSAPQQITKGSTMTSKGNPKTVSPIKKQQSSGSAVGKRIARKTAHSVIERRRRSKMNEEFSTLKDMIPACKGQELHKLAILQVCPSHHEQAFNLLPLVRRVSTTCAIYSHASMSSKPPTMLSLPQLFSPEHLYFVSPVAT